MSLLEITSRYFWRGRITFLAGIMLAFYLLLVIIDTSYSIGLSNPLIRANHEVNSQQSQCSNSSAVDTNWYPPAQTMINSLISVINGTGIYDYIFNSSTTPDSIPYDTYNWCNMPHVRSQEYKVPNPDYQLEYVEVIHRHHKRTPYASNTFPLEQYPWSCSDSHLYYYAIPDTPDTSAQITWQVTPPTLQLFPPTGFPNSSCQFPQITSGGLQDSHQHGQDLRSVYVNLLHFLPETYDPNLVTFRVTNNVITSQVAGQVIQALYPASLTNTSVPVIVQPSTLDSLEPTYSCPAATTLYSSYSVGSNNTVWLAHLSNPATISLFETLDSISGVNSSDSAWHDWVDHYFDNLSSKLCHDKPLGCNISNPSLCISQSMAEDIFRRGLYEYSYIYRDDPHSLAASTASFGVWIAEVAGNIRGVMMRGSRSHEDVVRADGVEGKDMSGENVIYRHNIAHDGSVSRLLSILQVDVMVWPGMGSEVVFELWKRRSSGCSFVRILWKGQVLRSASPMLQGDEDGMIEVDRFLGYVDGLVGQGGVRVPGLCAAGD